MNSAGNGSTLSPLSSMAARCFWDADTDSYAHDVFMNVSIGCFTMRKCKATCFCVRGQVTLNNGAGKKQPLEGRNRESTETV